MEEKLQSDSRTDGIMMTPMKWSNRRVCACDYQRVHDMTVCILNQRCSTGGSQSIFFFFNGSWLCRQFTFFC